MPTHEGQLLSNQIFDAMYEPWPAKNSSLPLGTTPKHLDASEEIENGTYRACIIEDFPKLNELHQEVPNALYLSAFSNTPQTYSELPEIYFSQWENGPLIREENRWLNFPIIALVPNTRV